MSTSNNPLASAVECEQLEKEFKIISQSIREIIKGRNDNFRKIEETRKLEEAKKLEEVRKLEEAKKLEAAKAKQLTTEPGSQSAACNIVEDSTKLAVETEEADYVHKDDLVLYFALQSELQQHQTLYANFVNDPSLKQFKFDCQKAVNLPVNAISPQSAAHLRDKLEKIRTLLRGNIVEIGNRRFKATAHVGGLEYCTDLLARKLVRQGEDVVSSNPEAAFAIAAVITALWSEFPLLGRLILAHFYKTCPYLIPYYVPQQEGQSDQDYYKALGYQYTDGQVEKQDKFLKRMSGVARLFAAVIASVPQRHQQQQSHPFGLQNGWRFLASILNLKPRVEITATILYDFLDVTGHRLSQAYGKQFIKMIHLLCTDYFTLIRNVTPDSCLGPVVRLDDFLQKTLKRRELAPPAGQLPPGFW